MRRKGKDLFKGLMKLVSKRQNYDNEEATPTTAAEVDLSNYDLFLYKFSQRLDPSSIADCLFCGEEFRSQGTKAKHIKVT